VGTKVNHDLRSNNGHTIHLPGEIGGDVGAGNLRIPNVFEEDDVQLYPIGTRLANGNRTYHYYYAPAAIANTTLAIANYNKIQIGYALSYDASQPAGSATYKIDGSAAGTPAKNAYAGSYIVPFSALAIGRPQMRIVSNTISAYDSVYTTVYTTVLTLERPLPVVIAANTGNSIYYSQYADCRSAHAGAYQAFVGVPACNMTAAHWGWVLTWGPVFITATSVGPGYAGYARTMVFNSDGSIAPSNAEWVTGVASHQIAGYCLDETASVTSAGDQWIMLTLDP